MKAKKLVLVSAILCSTLMLVQTAAAVVCTVNMEKAYQEAVQNGWLFKCSGQRGEPVAFSFDNAKRPGCSGKAPIGLKPRINYFASFFKTFPSGKADARLKRGWKIFSYKVTGGQFVKWRTGPSRIKFTFSSKAGSHFKRHLSELKFAKNQGNCSKLYDEAF